MALVETYGNGVIYSNAQIWSPVHTPINWVIPPKIGGLAVIKKNAGEFGIYRVERIIHCKENNKDYCFLQNVNTNQVIIVAYHNTIRPTILFIRK